MKAIEIRMIVGVACVLTLQACSNQGKQASNHVFEKGAIVVQGHKGVVEKTINQYVKTQSIEEIVAEDHIYLVRYSGLVTPPELSVLLEKESGIGFAEPNFKVRAEDVGPIRVLDRFWVYQWALENIGQDSPHGIQGKPKADIRILEAWKKTKGDQGVIVAVLDTGVDYQHPDLKNNMWVNRAELEGQENGIRGVDDDGNGWADDVFGWNFISNIRTKPYFGQLGHPDPADDNGHGTHCAGIIGAKPNNVEGIAGINWNVQIMALKFLDEDGSGHNDDAARAIHYAIKNKANVLSMSWGSNSPSKLIKRMLKKTEKAGMVLVAAAGNGRSDNDQEDHYPSNYGLENMIAVAATDNRDQLATFSNHGIKTVHLAAPGVDIMSTIPRDGDVTTQDYAAYSGTSMATPMVVGAIALYLAAFPDARTKPAVVKKALMETVDQTQQLRAKVMSGGRLNVARLLRGQTNAMDDSVYETVTEDLEDVQSPKFPAWYPHMKVDHIWTITRDGALRIRVLLESFEIDHPYDLFSVYEKNYMHILTYKERAAYDEWTPWIEGDTVRIRFANGTVKVVFKERKEFDNVSKAKAEGATDCRPVEGSDRVVCSILRIKQPVFNHETEGFKVAKVQFIKRKTGQ